MITVTYFGNLKDLLQLTEEQISWEGGDTEVLLTQLRDRGALWAEALAPENIFRIVVNEEMTFEPTVLNVGDRVALLPPVTGG
ncbi:MoaD/ThiS family protein [Ignatzschineria cameli]|uniref:Molybdopterin synthase sulfur carrier subunit n=1 Tax=Ignatzschineria cameli TaxID=2182793 RepID=A0A2U2AR08_9GAMM|nr:MoaD/ThiS family protein [Ignatzschineria cameli]PWD85249.1 molybdopterin synthase sulfur carrier subunit [Ignatzschineria cameli]PWD86326.1 molybdopterin synthase sulfur carrier subunit [Ignatzschineria cameli]PWD89836.1 molybdopterin synthase sulfur carrier subunit [Ignatzschineria cameli]PWD91486.1 molybdopterin synthase sulfur carrier subunit [Ignatzschineria cameli]PWD92524.1 molybdopterin synthase sulfur carrier subunit [Ignatzschineria cameli]